MELDIEKPSRGFSREATRLATRRSRCTRGLVSYRVLFALCLTVVVLVGCFCFCCGWCCCGCWSCAGCSERLCTLQVPKQPRQRPHCSFFLRGECLKEDCPFSHVHVNKVLFSLLLSPSCVSLCVWLLCFVAWRCAAGFAAPSRQCTPLIPRVLCSGLVCVCVVWIWCGVLCCVACVARVVCVVCVVRLWILVCSVLMVICFRQRRCARTSLRASALPVMAAPRWRACVALRCFVAVRCGAFTCLEVTHSYFRTCGCVL
jgi:hypothetical protein